MSGKDGFPEWAKTLLTSSVMVLLTGLVTHCSALDADRNKNLLDQRKDAYVGYLSAINKAQVSGMPFGCDPEKDKLCQLRLDFEVEGGAAKRRIGVYGADGVVSATAAYSRALAPQKAACPETWPLDLAMFVEMRKDVLGETAVTREDLAELMLPCGIPGRSAPAAKGG